MANLEWRFLTTQDTLPDGFYWYRVGFKKEPPEYFEVLQVCNGVIVDRRPRDSYGCDWEVYEHNDFRGWWAGPIPIPPLTQSTIENFKTCYFDRPPEFKMLCDTCWYKTSCDLKKG